MRRYNYELDGQGAMLGARQCEMVISIQGKSDQIDLVVDMLHGMSWRQSGPGQKSASGSALDLATLLDCLKAAGADPDRPEVRREAEEVLAIIARTATSGFIAAVWSSDERGPVGRLESIVHGRANYGTQKPYPFTYFSGTMSWSGGEVLPLWTVSTLSACLLWAGGMVLIIRRAWRKGEMVSGSRTMTVLFSDMKDYTVRAAQASRQELVELIRQHQDLVRRAVERHRGKIIKSMGDGMLAAFDSATEAILAARQIQQVAANEQPSRMDLRIALSSGEVVIDAGDVYGPAVNVAARLQAHTPTGAVYFTDATRQMLNSAEVQFDEAGEFELKGVRGNVRAFRVM